MTKQEFYQIYCRYCGGIRCGGPGDEFAEGCPYFIDWEESEEVFLPEPDEEMNFYSIKEEG